MAMLRIGQVRQPYKLLEYLNMMVKAAFQAGLTDDFFGVPAATTPALLNLIDNKNPPVRLMLDAHNNAQKKPILASCFEYY